MSTGQVADLSWSGPMDGTLHPVKGGRGSRASFTEDGTAHFEIKDVVENASFSISEDGKTLTQVVTVKTKSGETQHAKWIYNRVK